MAANSSFLGGVHGLFLVWVALRDLGNRPFKCMFMSLTLHYPRSRLQTGIQGAFGKPQGIVARVHIGQVKSICTKLQNKEHVIEAPCRAKFKFPGRQKIHISKKWGFTKFNVDECEDMVAEKQLIPDGCRVKYIPNHDPLDKWQVRHW
ncbi:large ribosomal subunit protein uL16-like [Pongo pygmaeus]|uniref:large ribosomal subunit protein uL16-like n=1 Tax=Pongo pygmaeus TaxID=9600 RepID=UPI0023E2864F|nr:60S ribosomal protein L10-like [Pongo pygmaeus]XP_054417074.1 60S ribosomal protein L10-like [Pongo abelii]